MACSVRFSPHSFVPGSKCDTYACHLCGQEEDRYQLREQPDGAFRQVDVSSDPCCPCIKRLADLDLTQDPVLGPVLTGA